MKTDFHHNIFYFYKGSQEDDDTRSRQLEDNTTKALINILENVDSKITERFLRFVGITSDVIGDIDCCLQKNDIGTSALQRKKELMLLTIVPEKKNVVPFTCTSKHYSRPDAWIHGNKFAILVESKVVGYLNYPQMLEHYRKLAENAKGTLECAEITWGDVQRFFRNEITAIECAKSLKDVFLLNQFMEYLDMCNLADFNGFDSEFFDYFFSHDNDESRLWAKNKIQLFASLMFDEMTKVDASFYQEFDQGQLKLKDDAAWVAFGPKDNKYRKLAHLTIRFNSQGIEIFINLETKPATENLKQIMKNHPTEFKKALKELCDVGDLTFVLEKREHAVASKYNYHKLLELESYSLAHDEMSESTFNFFVSLINSTDLPSINIVKKIDRVDAIDLSSGASSKELIHQIIKITTKFHAFISFANQPSSSVSQDSLPV